MAQDQTRFKRNPDYVFRSILDEIVLVPIRSDVADMDCIYTMNPIGAFIWQRIDGQATVADIRSALVEEYDSDPATVAADLLEFLGDLESAGAVWRV